MPKNILAEFWRKKLYHRIDRIDRLLLSQIINSDASKNILVGIWRKKSYPVVWQKKPEEWFSIVIPEPEVEKRLLKAWKRFLILLQFHENFLCLEGRIRDILNIFMRCMIALPNRKRGWNILILPSLLPLPVFAILLPAPFFLPIPYFRIAFELPMLPFLFRVYPAMLCSHSFFFHFLWTFALLMLWLRDPIYPAMF